MTERKYIQAHTLVMHDVEYAMECLCIARAINDIAQSDPSALRHMNKQPVVWNAINVALQESFIIALGRLFDTDNRTHSIHYLISETLRHPEFFSREALARRKRTPNSDHDPDWLEEYLDEAWQPTSADLRYLKGALKQIARKYEDNFAPIRNRVIAHRERLDKHEVKGILDRGLITQLEEILNSLHDLLRELWHLIYNGEKPRLEVGNSDFLHVTRRSAIDALRHLITADTEVPR